MAKKENAQIHCPCPQCNGKLTDPVAYMQHTGKVSSGMAEQPERIFYMGEWWRKEEV